MSGIVLWVAWCLGLGLLLGVAARLAESAARGVGAQARWTWFGAMALTVAVPVLSWLGLRDWVTSMPALPDAMVFALPMSMPAVAVEGGLAAAPVDPTSVLLAVWAVLSAGVAAWLAMTFTGLRRSRRGWRAERVGGLKVLVTRDVGPAVFGLRRTAILLPEWALALDAELRGMMLLHEHEHVRARDPVLLAAGLALFVAMPWNPALWWQLRRMRMAIEMDCDARVLRRGGDAHRYGALLLEVGRRRAPTLPVLALSEPASFLERRIRQFTRRARRGAGRRALGLSTVAVALVVLAVCTRDPLSPTPRPAGEELAVSTGGPEFTPYTVGPVLQNPAQIEALLQRNYPPLLRDAGISAVAHVWLFVSRTGEVQESRLHETTGHEALDEAALRVVRAMEFSPAENRGQPTAVWINMALAFRERTGEEGPPAEREYSTDRIANTPPAGALSSGGPTFTPMTVRPSLVNPAEVQQALTREYPPMLRDAGIGGRTLIWFHIDETGEVRDAQLNQSSGYEVLDEAALRVGRSMRFTPALNRDERVAVWVAIPITFSSK